MAFDIPGSKGMGDLKGKSPEDMAGQIRRPGAKNLKTEVRRSFSAAMRTWRG